VVRPLLSGIAASRFEADKVCCLSPPIAKFVHHVYLVFSARGAWDVGHEVSLRPGEEVRLRNLLSLLHAALLMDTD
jgi:hypothetical protein